ncbi:MAG: ABC transporter permease [Bacteroidales bacterium]|nr:ABC transporter permease [Bacteroidales bacterium]
MFKHYLTIAVRNLLHNKFQTLFSIVGLAVAFFCFGFCSYFVYGLLSIDTYYKNHDRVLMLKTAHFISGTKNEWIRMLEEQCPEVEAVFRFNTEANDYTIDENDIKVNLLTIECDTTLRHIYNPTLLAGSWHGAEHSPNSFIMTESFAKKLFENPDKAIGQQLTLAESKPHSQHNSNRTYTVQAVVEDLPFNNTIQMCSPMAAWVFNDENGEIFAAENTEESQYIHFYEPRILLREDVDPAAFIKRLDALEIDTNVSFRFNNEERTYRNLSADYTFDIEQIFDKNWVFVLLLLGILTPGFLILLSALSNFFHLLISNIMMRRREYTLRRVHGAHTRHLWYMVSTQVCLKLLLVSLFTLVIVELGAPLLEMDFNSNARIALDKNEMLRQTLNHIVFLLLMGLGVAWLAVARIRKDSLQESMKTSTGRRPGRHNGRNILMGWQMFIGFLFTTILGGLILQININKNAQHPWLTSEEKREILFVPSNLDTEKDEALLADIRAIPEVKEVIFMNKDIANLEISTWRAFNVLTEAGDTLDVGQGCCNTQVLQFIKVPLQQGRWAEKDDEVVIDKIFAERSKLHIGDQIEVPFNERYYAEFNNIKYFKIVGIIDNAMQKTSDNHNRTSWKVMRGGIYFNFPFENCHFAVKSQPGKAEKCAQELVQCLLRHDIVRDSQYSFKTLYKSNENNSQGEKEILPIFWLFASIALIITMLGTYSAIHVDTSARRKEMAIRKINGAKAHHIAFRFVRLYIILLVVTAAIAFPLTYLFFNIFVNEYGEKFNYGFLFYTCIFLLMAIFVALTIGVQIWQIARINPSKIIKEE